MSTAIIPLALLGLVPFFVLADRSITALPLVARVSPTIALVLAYRATVLVQHQAAQRLMPAPRYVYPQWGFSVVACVMMLLVVVLR